MFGNSEQLPISLLAELHHSQAGSGRHRCPTCAYEQGFNLGSSGYWSSYDEYCNTLKDSEICQIGSIAPSHILSNLGDNQGLVVNHPPAGGFQIKFCGKNRPSCNCKHYYQYCINLDKLSQIDNSALSCTFYYD